MLKCIACNEPVHIHNKECVHWRVTTDDNGVIRDSMSYSFDSTVCHGVDKVFDADGHLGAIVHYSYGKRQGKTLLFYKGGAVMQVDGYENDKFHGYSVSYYPNGNIKTLDSIVDGKRVGATWEFNIDGTVNQVGSVRNYRLLNSKGDQYQENY